MALTPEKRAVFGISVLTQQPRSVGPPQEKRRADLQERRIPLAPKRRLADHIESNLRLLCKGCLNDGLTFSREEQGRRYCCLFLEGSQYRGICSYLSEDMVHVRSYGCDMMRYGCKKAQS